RPAERRALAQDRDPRQAGLERLQRHPLVQRVRAVQLHAPLGVVVVDVVRGRVAPRAANDHRYPSAKEANRCNDRRSISTKSGFTNGKKNGTSRRSVHTKRLPRTANTPVPRTTRPRCSTSTACGGSQRVIRM